MYTHTMQPIIYLCTRIIAWGVRTTETKNKKKNTDVSKYKSMFKEQDEGYNKKNRIKSMIMCRKTKFEDQNQKKEQKKDKD